MRNWFAVAVALLWFALGAAAQTTPVAGGAGSGYIDAGGSKLYFEECGSGPGVVLLHDGLLHSVTWDEVWPALCSKYHVVRYDRRGYGRSEAAKAPFSAEKDLEQVLRRTGMAHAVLVGNSSGAGLALDFAISHPAMVEGLFLIGPVVHGMRSSAFFLSRGERNNAPLAHDDVKGAAENWSKDAFAIAGTNEAARKKVFEALAQNPQNLKIAGQFEKRPAPPTVVRLGEIEAPTLMLVGAADIADVHAFAGAIQAAVPVSRREVWADAGHMIQLEKPQEVVARLERFVTLVERKRVALNADVLRSYAGQYSFFGQPTTVAVKGDHLILQLNGDADIPLFAASDTRFFVRTVGTDVQFQKDAAGKVIEMGIYSADGNVIKCPRL